MDEHLQPSRACIEEDPLLAEFELAGLIGEDYARNLPEHLSLVFEIARVIENPDTDLGTRLARIMTLQTPSDSTTTPSLPTVIAEEYEADLLRHFHELPLIYPYQFLLPEEVFYQRLAERSLWMPRPIPPRSYRFPTASDTFAPDPRKQKVYVLFDISRSMNSHWRIMLAKAIAVVFLKRNMRELGTIFFRTFAENTGHLIRADDVPSLQHLLRTILLLQASGRGTNMQQALEQAITDIISLQSLSDAEILVITDGAAHLDVERLRLRMGSNIRVHAIKIGHETITPDPAMVESIARKIGTGEARRLLELQERRRQLDRELQLASTSSRRSMLAHDIGVLDRLIADLAARVALYATEHFGTDLERISTVYIELEDIDPATVFHLSPEREVYLEHLAHALLDEFGRTHRTDDAERIAALLDHLRTLLHFNPHAQHLRATVDSLDAALRQYLRQVRFRSAETTISTQTIAMLDHVRFVLKGTGSEGLSFGELVKLLWRRLIRWFRRQRQLRLARVLIRRAWRKG